MAVLLFVFGSLLSSIIIVALAPVVFKKVLPVVSLAITSSYGLSRTKSTVAVLSRTVSVILMGVFARVSDLQVLKSVIVLNTIQMMNNFSGLQVTTKVLLYNKPMLKNIAITFCIWVIRLINKNVTQFVSNLATFPVGVVFAGGSVNQIAGVAQSRRSSFGLRWRGISQFFVTYSTMFDYHKLIVSSGII